MRILDLFRETIETEAHISWRDVIPGFDLSGQETTSEWRVSNYCDAELLCSGDDYGRVGSAPR